MGIRENLVLAEVIHVGCRWGVECSPYISAVVAGYFCGIPQFFLA